MVLTESTASDGQYLWTIPIGLATDTTYRVKITSISRDSVYDYSDTPFIINSSPVTPTSLTAAAGNRQVTLRWSPNTEVDLQRYNIYRGTSSPAATLIHLVVGNATLPDTFYVDGALTNGQTYFYRITAVDSVGNESGFSNEVSAAPVSKEIVLSDSSNSFGDVQVETTKEWTLYIRNVGTDTLTVSNISTPSLSVFSLSSTSGVINPSDSLGITVSFTPTAIKAYLDTLMIRSNDSDVSDEVKFVYLSGAGVDVIAPSVPQGLTATAGDRQVTLRWSPNTEPDLEAYRIYRGTSSPAATLIHIVVAGSLSDTLYVDKELTGGQTYFYRITAVDTVGNEGGVSNEVSDTPVSKEIALSDSSHSFGDVQVETTNDWTLYIINLGTSPLSVTDISSSSFPVFGLAAVIGPGDSLTVTVSFTPMVSKVHLDTLTIRSNDSDPSDTLKFVYLSGAGIAPLIATSDDSIHFGAVRRDSTQAIKFTVSNTGTDTLLVSDLSVSNPVFEVSHTFLKLAPSDSQEVYVTFTPEEPIDYQETLTLIHSGFKQDNVEIVLKGQGVKPTITASVMELGFGGILIGRDSLQTFFIRNKGHDVLTIDSVMSSHPAFSFTSVGVLYAQLLVSMGNDPGVAMNRLPRALDSRPSVSRKKYLGATISPMDQPFGGDDSFDKLKAGSDAGRGQDRQDFGELNPNRTKHDRLAGNVAASTIRINPGDSLQVGVRYSPPESGIMAGSLMIFSDDPDRSELDILLTGEGITYPVALYNSTSFGVTTMQGRDEPFDLVISNGGDYPLDYAIEIDATWDTYEWLSLSRESGQVAGGNWQTIAVTVAPGNLEEALYQGRLLIISNSGPYLSQVTDTVGVSLNVLSATAEITSGDATIPAGDTPPIEITDDSGNSLGLTFDFSEGQGGTISVTAIQSSPPSEATTPFVDPDGLVMNPVFAEFYWEIFTTVPEGFMVDIIFDYSRLLGIQNPGKLRLTRRMIYAGPGVIWQLIDTDSVDVDPTRKTITALSQTGFSQWTIASDVLDNSLRDIQVPVMSVPSVSPESPSVLEDITVYATVIDESSLNSVSFYYLKGGESNFRRVDMRHDGSGDYSGIIPAADVTLMGIAYTIHAIDVAGNSSRSDTLSVQVKFRDNTLVSNMNGSALMDGMPKDKWRLISVPAELDDPDVSHIFGDELKGESTKTTWRILEWTGSNWTDAKKVSHGEGYWLYQQVKGKANVVFSTGSGRSIDLTGTTLTLQPGWNLIGSPYPFVMDVDVDQDDFYGPLMYGGSGGEGWSDVVTQLKPWGGYALYNRATSTQTIDILPLKAMDGHARLALRAPSGVYDGTAHVGADLSAPIDAGRHPSPSTDGWKLQVSAQGEFYADMHNYVGRIPGAHEQLDHFDNPEPPYLDGYVSLAMDRPAWGTGLPRFTSDLRSLDETDGTWDLDLHVKGEVGPISLTYKLSGELPPNIQILLLDLVSRQDYDLLRGEGKSIMITDYTQAFPYHLKVIAGSPEYVSRTVSEVLSLLPEKIALSQNYPNPFNPSTRIRFALPKPEQVTLKVYNILGQEVVTLVDGWRDLGRYEVIWDGKDHLGYNVSSGLYFSALVTANRVLTRKMMVIR